MINRNRNNITYCTRSYGTNLSLRQFKINIISNDQYSKRGKNQNTASTSLAYLCIKQTIAPISKLSLQIIRCINYKSMEKTYGNRKKYQKEKGIGQRLVNREQPDTK